MRKDLISGLVLLAGAGTYYAWAGEIADSTLSDEVGAAGLPHVLAIVLAILGILLMGRTLLASQARQVAAGADDDERDARLPRAVGFLLFGAAYVILLPFVGYVIGTALLIGGIALYEGAPRTWVVPVAAIGGGIFYWAVFVKLLGVHQPAGSLVQGLF
ncbi:tripartite tricarboxylate transporter TctB family protein [Phyllobacterium sp. BT25]|uniref:Tripartite tricarboxylate transporter TctB family protein n=1 Tax=Phyllobacterium pellucidum TaxID=2740464 RepID=A0A849VUG5_9HYPH|nr:tripartite tricarboxylate transporter TctB family protein [Phyllobacterium pellucidum]NTS33316.1 tripartite tricarboxylate transporter TctB family protein [Phyllobacterium pellucidum]